MTAITRYFIPAILTACVALTGFFWVREEVTTRIYREKILDLSREYAALADQYNHAVRQSAITELEVTPDTLTVVIRTLEGTIRRIPTPFNPQDEIFVDYILGDGRIWDGSLRSRLTRKIAEPLIARLTKWRDRRVLKQIEQYFVNDESLHNRDGDEDSRPIVHATHEIRQCHMTGNILKPDLLQKFLLVENGAMGDSAEVDEATADFQRLYDDEYFASGILDERLDWGSKLLDFQNDFWRHIVTVGLRDAFPGLQKRTIEDSTLESSRPRALDVGCGAGALAGRLNVEGFRVMAIDLSEAAVNMAKLEQTKPERVGLIDREVEFRRIALKDQPCDPAYDLITLTHVIEHIAEDVELFREIHKRLASDGRLYVETTWAARRAFALRPDWWLQDDHCREYTKIGLAAVVEAAGFEILSHADALNDDPPMPYQFLLAEKKIGALGEKIK